MSIFGEGNKLFQKKLEMDKKQIEKKSTVSENAVEKGNLKISQNVSKCVDIAAKE